jgi:myo-inositol-1(or 4)-monophosphatase
MNLERIIKEALPALQKTGTWIQKEAQSFDLNKVVLKGKNDLVSYVDKEAEKKLVTDLKKILPEAGFITEEDTTDDDQKEFIWIIDPQDGTTNYIHGLPVYSISVGPLQGRNVVGGIVYELNKMTSFMLGKVEVLF